MQVAFLSFDHYLVPLHQGLSSATNEKETDGWRFQGRMKLNTRKAGQRYEGNTMNFDCRKVKTTHSRREKTANSGTRVAVDIVWQRKGLIIT